MSDVELIDGNLRIYWVNLGEGNSGDYDPNDPEDQELLRFDVEELVDGKWEFVDDSSYCTNTLESTPSERLLELLKEMIVHIRFSWDHNGHSIRKVCELLSWISAEGIPEWVLSDIEERKKWYGKEAAVEWLKKEES
jgi:hypothetical protein